MNKNIRVLIGKPGLDGHDKGAKVICHALREAGMEVIYTGLHRTIEQIVNSAVEEDVDAIGLSILSGAHLHYADKLISALQQADAADITTFIGGVIPDRDIAKLKAIGINGIFPGGLPLKATVDFLQNPTGEQ